MSTLLIAELVSLTALLALAAHCYTDFKWRSEVRKIALQNKPAPALALPYLP